MQRLSDQISVDQAKITLLRVLYCLQQNQLSDQQAEDLFFNVTKIFQLNNRNLSAIAIQIISIIQSQVKSSFFVTRSLVQAYEQNDSLKAQSTRLISKVTNQSSIGECQKLVKNSCMNKDNKRLISSAAVASSIKQIGISDNLLQQSNQIENYNVFCAIKGNDKYQIQIKNCCSYIAMAMIDSMQNQQEMIKNIILVLPDKDAQVKWSDKALYLDCFKKLAKMQISYIKIYQQKILNSWALIMKNIQSQEEWYTVAMMRYIIHIYSGLAQLQAQFQVPNSFLEIISQIQQNSSNQQVRTTCLLLSIQNQFKPDDLQQLYNMIEKIDESQMIEIKEIMIQACQKPELSQIIIDNSLNLINNDNQYIKMIAIDSLTLVLNQDVNADIKYSIIKQLLTQINNQTENGLFDQIIQVVGQLPLNSLQQQEINSLVFEYAILYDNDSAKQYIALQNSKQAEEMNQLLQSDEIKFEDEQIELQNFNVEQLVEQQEDFMNNKEIQFNKQKIQNSPVTQIQEIIKLNPQYKQYIKYHTGDAVEITPEDSEVKIQVTKIFYLGQNKKEIMLVFNVENNDAQDVNIIIDNKILKQQDGQYLKFIQVQNSFDEIEEISNNKVNYVIDDEEEDIKCDDIRVLPYDLTEQVLIDDYQKQFEQLEQNNIKFQMQDIQSAQQACEILSSNLNLYIDQVQMDGRHCYCWFTGKNFENDQIIIIKCEAKELKQGGVGVKLDYRGEWSQKVIDQI